MFVETLVLKLRYILGPYVRVLGLFMAATALFHAALFAAAPTCEPADWLWTFAGPGVGCTALVLLALWPRFRLIREGRSGRGSLGQLLAAVAIITLGLAWGSIGHLLRATLAPLRALPTLAVLDRSAPARYYQVGQLTLDPLHVGLEQQVETTGRHDEHLNFTLLVACPVAAGRGPEASVPAWLGFRYSHQMSSRASDAEKEAAYRDFLRTSKQQFDLDRQRPFTYLERCPNDGERQGLRAAASHSDHYRAAAAPPLLLLPVYTPFAERGRSAGRVLLWSAAIGNGVFVLLLLVLPFDAQHRQALLAGQPISYSPGWLADYGRPFYPRPGYVATPLLLAANLLIYGLMAGSTASGFNSFAPPVLLAWGATYGPALAAGEWWRLLASTFIHGGLLHLVNNMVLLGLLGWQLERALGGWRVLTLYVVAGVGASLVSYWWHPDRVSVGASGALFGWIGLGLTLFWRPQADGSLKVILAGVAFVSGGLSLLFGLLTPNVDNAAHLGGLAIGLGLGRALWPWLRPALEASKELQVKD